jgi:hypothetical protein
MTKVRIMETQGNHDMKEVKIRIQPATKQEQLQVDLRPLHHIILLKRILVRDVDPIQQIQKMDMYETTHKETVEEVVDNPESVVEPTHNQNISLKEIAITIMVVKLKIVTMVEITTKNQEITNWISNLDLVKRTAKTRKLAKVKRAMQVTTKTGEEPTKEAITQIFLKKAMKKISQMKKKLLELETECPKNLIQNKERIFLLECL